jgi:hypothetical protein
LIVPWGGKKTMAVRCGLKTEEASSGPNTVTRGGVQLGVSITSFEDTARESLGCLLPRPVALAYSGAAVVEDARGFDRFEHSKIRVKGQRGRFKGTQLA